MQVNEALKELYRTDSIDKNMIAEFRRPGQSEPFLTVHEGSRFIDMSLEESLCSDENIEWGSCEASQIKLTIIGLNGAGIKGSEMTLYQTLDGVFPATDLYPADDTYPAGYVMPFGKYVVQSAKKQANTDFWDVTALDYMSKFDANVVEWYNSLAFPLSLRDFRASLCKYLGVTEEVPDYLPNDDMLVEKTIDAGELTGKDVLIACEQVNGVFGHFDREGVLQHVALEPNYGLFPATDLYPSDDLYPVAPGEMNDQVYDERLEAYLMISSYFEDYTIQSIDKIQIRQESEDIGAIYGTGSNCYTIEGNFLLYGKGADDLAAVATNVYGMISGRMYIPFNCELKGLPYISVGNAVYFAYGSESIVSYIMNRTLKGTYALKDSYSAEGEEIRSVQNNVNKDILLLKGKAAYLKKNVDEVSANLVDLEKQTEANLTITAEKIEAEVKRASEAEGNLSSLISQTAESITLMVKKGEVSAQLSIESGGIDIKGDRFSWTATNSSLTADGTLTVNQGLFKGSIDVGNGQFTVDSSGKVVAKSIEVGTSSSRAVLYGSTVLATNFSCNSSFNVDCYANMADIGGNTISCGTLRANHIYGSIDDFSDRRLKQNIHPMDAETAIRIIKQLKPVSYSMKRYDREGIGFIAQDVQKICLKQGIDLPLYGRRGKYLTIPYINYIPLLVAVVQSQQKEIDRLKRLIG
mgnify:FL=1